jgi:hypothetical protein
MSNENQKRFLVTYLIPASVMEAWKTTESSQRNAAEEKMRGAWSQWMDAHAKSVLSTDAGGKTRRVTSSCVAESRNDIVVCSVVVAESQEDAARMFDKHPHLQIPQSSIEHLLAHSPC